jgi:hypothetical protein
MFPLTLQHIRNSLVEVNYVLYPPVCTLPCTCMWRFNLSLWCNPCLSNATGHRCLQAYMHVYLCAYKLGAGFDSQGDKVGTFNRQDGGQSLGKTEVKVWCQYPLKQ